MAPAFFSYCGVPGANGGPGSRFAVCQSGSTAAVLAQFAPDKFVVQSSAALGSINQQFDIVGNRLSELRDANLGSGGFGLSVTRSLTVAMPSTSPAMAAGPAAAPAQGAPAAAPPISGGSAAAADAGAGAIAPSAFGLYFRVEGRDNKSNPTDFDPGFKARSAGLTVGGDYLLSANGVLGAALSYDNSRSALSTADAAPSGNVTTRGTGMSLYGAYYPAPSAYVDATLVYGRNKYSSRRDIPVLTDTAVGETSGNQYGLNVGGGYSFLSSHLNYGPYLRAAFSRTRVDAFTEQQNPSASNLSVQEQRVTSMSSTLGAQISYSASQRWGVLVPNARLEWEHQYKDDRTKTILANFAGDPSGAASAIATTPADRNYFNLGLGLAAHFGVGRSAFIYYQTVLGRSGQSSNAVTAELRVEL